MFTLQLHHPVDQNNGQTDVHSNNVLLSWSQEVSCFQRNTLQNPFFSTGLQSDQSMKMHLMKLLQ